MNEGLLYIYISYNMHTIYKISNNEKNRIKCSSNVKANNFLKLQLSTN